MYPVNTVVIDELKAELARLTAQVKWMTDERTELRAELEKLRADAGRWQWWLDHFNATISRDLFICSVFLPTQERDKIGAAIDALRAEGGE
jgi:FtsZ-binding cell division protein ZapB